MAREIVRQYVMVAGNGAMRANHSAICTPNVSSRKKMVWKLISRRDTIQKKYRARHATSIASCGPARVNDASHPARRATQTLYLSSLGTAGDQRVTVGFPRMG